MSSYGSAGDRIPVELGLLGGTGMSQPSPRLFAQSGHPL